MKKGYIRLIIFLTCVFSLILLDTLFFKLLKGYIAVLFTLVLIGIFHKLFMLEKDHHRYFKEVLFEIFFYTILYFVLFYLLGLVVGLYRTPNYYTLTAFRDVIIPIILFSIVREILRYNMLCKAEGSKICTVLVVIVVLFLDTCSVLALVRIHTQYDVLKLIALTLFPAVSRNISYSYITRYTGYKPVIIFDLIFSLYAYFIPLLPNPSEYVMAIIYLMVPILFAFRMRRFFERRKDHLLPSDYKKKKLQGIIVPVLIVATLVYFYSGYFRYYAVAIASGSMTPNILKGDIVVVDQSLPHDLEIGDVIAYRHEKIIVVHRIVSKIDIHGTYTYYTKGDANSNVDDVAINDDMILGKVKFKLPYIGWPTVWFNKE